MLCVCVSDSILSICELNRIVKQGEGFQALQETLYFLCLREDTICPFKMLWTRSQW